MKQSLLIILNTIAQVIYDKKGLNILALDMKGNSSITDYVIIAEGNVDRHVIAIADAVKTALSEKGIKLVYEEGMKSGDWIVLDYLEVMVHIFMPGLREKYQLERLWKDAEIVDLTINISQEKAAGYSGSL